MEDPRKITQPFSKAYVINKKSVQQVSGPPAI